MLQVPIRSKESIGILVLQIVESTFGGRAIQLVLKGPTSWD
jgi:hypothetical protein